MSVFGSADDSKSPTSLECFTADCPDIMGRLTTPSHTTVSGTATSQSYSKIFVVTLKILHTVRFDSKTCYLNFSRYL
ncbi:MAG: hypothetical protein K2H82_08140 [Oscillospiraceae bacterium]|nr:hypothetical protein [Oscillospiraceae bacterium]